jgi:hypothetical protein
MNRFVSCFSSARKSRSGKKHVYHAFIVEFEALVESNETDGEE